MTYKRRLYFNPFPLPWFIFNLICFFVSLWGLFHYWVALIPLIITLSLHIYYVSEMFYWMGGNQR